MELSVTLPFTFMSRSCHSLCLLKGLAGADSSGMSLQYPHHRREDGTDHPGAGEAQSQCGQGEFASTNFVKVSCHVKSIILII